MTNRQRFEDKRMSIAATAEKIIRETMAERGLKKPDARRVVAREVGVKPGALERLGNGSLVHVERITDRINAYVVQRLERKIADIEHELALARLKADRTVEPDIDRARAALEDARRALRHDGK
ncbi:Hypothetical protein BN69_1618 [Methylocystis sp. SC2]|nr:Hypothetical protein BN69_1618 [Methylocystis sp. SC2]